ncbi:MAG: hypothetical protein DCC71_14780 [Proteobacteria bacterium]|nr:MAG: hypothetical protein DCC71_14780 [Pseudomonadota bacterium]
MQQRAAARARADHDDVVGADRHARSPRADGCSARASVTRVTRRGRAASKRHDDARLRVPAAASRRLPRRAGASAAVARAPGAVPGALRAHAGRPPRDPAPALPRLQPGARRGPGRERTGRDADVFDETSHHILVTDERSGVAVGTYRLATLESASLGAGFYTAQEFDLSGLPHAVLAHAAELGRACIAAPHRGRHVLALLFQGIAAYAAHNRKRYLFGCASLPASAAPAAAALTRALAAQGSVDPALAIRARPGFEAPCGEHDDATPVALPPLVKRYLRLGAKLGPEPAFDRAFGTLDYFTLLDFERRAPA